jgi:hypothetical protein
MQRLKETSKMYRILQAVRAGLLATALVLLGWGAVSAPSDAEAAVCSGAGKSCVVIKADGKTEKYKEIIDY